MLSRTNNVNREISLGENSTFHKLFFHNTSEPNGRNFTIRDSFCREMDWVMRSPPSMTRMTINAYEISLQSDDVFLNLHKILPEHFRATKSAYVKEIPDFVVVVDLVSMCDIGAQPAAFKFGH